MFWHLLLLLVIAGPGPGGWAPAAADAAVVPWQWHRHRDLTYPRHLLQLDKSTGPVVAPSDNSSASSLDCEASTSVAGCLSCEQQEGSSRCTACEGSLLLFTQLRTCGCPAGTYNSAPNTCRDCPKGSFCAGGTCTGQDNVPPAVPCTIYGQGLTTLGSRSSRKEACVNLPGYYYALGSGGDPQALPCPVDTYQPGLRKQWACVPCPPGYTSLNRTMQTNFWSCDIDACFDAPCAKNMDCFDLPRPAGGSPEGPQCNCTPGTTYLDEVMGCLDPAETAMIGGLVDNSLKGMKSFQLRCPPGAFIVAISGVGGERIQSLGPVTCSDGSGAPLAGSFGIQTLDGLLTTRLAQDGFTGLTITADALIKSTSWYRRDAAHSATYGTMADYLSMQGRQQSLTCPNFGVAIGIIGVTSMSGAPAVLGFVCSGLPCPVREETVFGPVGAGSVIASGSPSNNLQNSPEPVQTATGTQCCSLCTHDFRCQYWVREVSTGNCWRVHAEPAQPGVPIPAEWSYQRATGFQAGPSITKTSGISVSGTYMGCFRDSGCSSSTRLRATLAANSDKMTVKACIAMANLAGWPLAGLAPGAFPGTTSCFGGDRLPPATAAVVGGCLAACSGNATERCGDSSNCQVSIYAVQKPRWPLASLDKGDQQRAYGWYDVQCQGALNDYCRWANLADGSYWSCVLAGAEVQFTAAGAVTEQFATSVACEEVGYKAQAQTDLSCPAGDLSLPWANNCRSRQCCKAQCDADLVCTGFVFGNSAGDNCRSAGDGQNCCWLKGGSGCQTVSNPLVALYQKAPAVMCAGFPPDPQYGIMFYPDNGNVGTWQQGTRCSAECQHGIQDSDQKPYVVCQSNGSWSDIVGLCKAPCPFTSPALCP